MSLRVSRSGRRTLDAKVLLLVHERSVSSLSPFDKGCFAARIAAIPQQDDSFVFYEREKDNKGKKGKRRVFDNIKFIGKEI